jgi:hypothetical protein
MGRLSHLMQDDSAPVYKLDFGENVSVAVAEIMGQEAARRLAPIIADLISEVDRLDGTVKNGTKSNDQAAKAVSDAIMGASKKVEREMARQMEEIRKGIRRVSKESRDGAKSDMDGFKKTLIEAMSRVQIPDYTDQLAEMRGAILAALESDDDDDPREWEFTVNRNRNGYIQSVSAKAK